MGIEARSDEVKSDEAKSDSSDADLEASIWPKLPPHKARVAKTSVKPHVEETRAHINARTKLARRHGNPLDARATDTRVQTWPCRSGGICSWQR